MTFLTLYLTQSSTYQDARTYSIIAANYLYGSCSRAVIATTNAWYAVGIGAVFAVTSDFSASPSTICANSGAVTFTNASANGISYTWYFGDGDTSSTANPVHTYNSPGTYNVSLAVNGGTCGSDSLTKTGFVTINSTNPPAAIGGNICNSGSTTLSATALGTGSLYWYSAASR